MCNQLADTISNFDANNDGMVDPSALHAAELCGACSAAEAALIVQDIASVARTNHRGRPQVSNALWIDNCIGCVPTNAPTTSTAPPIAHHLKFRLNFISKHPRYMHSVRIDQDILNVLHNLVLEKVSSSANFWEGERPPTKADITADKAAFVERDVSKLSEKGMLQLDDDGESLYEALSFSHYAVMVHVRMELTDGQRDDLLEYFRSEEVVVDLVAGIDAIDDSSKAHVWGNPTTAPTVNTVMAIANLDGDSPTPAPTENTFFSIVDLEAMGAHGLLTADELEAVGEMAEAASESKSSEKTRTTSGRLASHKLAFALLISGVALIGAVMIGVVGAAITAHRRHRPADRAHVPAMGAEMALTPAYIVASL
jgi:hypothetical protein